MLVMVQVTEVGVPVPTDTVPEVKVLPPLAALPLYRPKVTPEAMEAIAPMEAATPTARAIRFLDSFMVVILCWFVSRLWCVGGTLGGQWVMSCSADGRTEAAGRP